MRGGALTGWLSSLLGGDEPDADGGNEDAEDEEIRNKLEQLGYLE